MDPAMLDSSGARTTWKPRRDITPYELALAVPVLLALRNNEKPPIPLPIRRHFEFEHYATPLGGWKASMELAETGRTT